MALTVTMPQLGESVTEGTINRWLKKPGDPVKRYESLADVITDKVNAEIPAPADGVMGKWIAQEGDVVPVGKPICVIEGTGEVAAAAASTADVSNGDVSPAVRALASEHGVDVSQIKGSGEGGRVTKKNVMDYVERSGAKAASSVAVAPRAADDGTLVPLSPVRRAIAEHMVRSKHVSPHAWTMVEVDMSRVVAAREQQRDAFQAQYGFALTYIPFVADAVVRVLREFPSLNAWWTDSGIVHKTSINLGIAVAAEEGLVVPVVHNAQNMTLVQFAQAIHDVSERGRGGKLRVEDVEGGTFTLNNAGALGTIMSQAIINQPQAAILVTDAVVKRAVVTDDGSIAARPMMNLCMSFDHRMNDGLTVARFLQVMKKRLEEIELRFFSNTAVV